MKRLIPVIALLLFGSMTIMKAGITLPDVFSDNMVLQQNSDAAIWGTAEPGAKVIISQTWSSGKTTAVADSEGRWKASIPTVSAGGPYEICIRSGKEKITISNVLLGEVWICAGQSNMEMQMKGFAGQPVNDAAYYISGASPETPIRSCNFKRVKSLKEEDNCPAKWYVNDPEGVAEASATAYFFALRLYETLKVPVGVINVSWGGTPIEAWMDKELIEKEFADEFDMEFYARGEFRKDTPHRAPGVLYNGMLHALVPFTAKGFIWYQGCDNRARFEQYKRLQPAFVKMLREQWGNEDMPFYFTQIAPYEYENPDGRTGGYMMWAQAQTLAMIPHSGMATTHDAGEKACIHPAEKKKVGDRLAFLALSNDYGIKGFDPEAPIFSSVEFLGDVARVKFDVGKMGLSPINMDIPGFELAGEDHVFHPATARISRDKSVIEVKSPDVKSPVAVRYGMRNWSEATLFNCYGIPASPFRSDNWE